MSTVFFDISIVVASPGRVKGAFRCVSRGFPSRSLPRPAGSPAPPSRRRGGRLAVASRRRAGHCRYVFFRFRSCVRCARASHSGSVLSKVRTWNLYRIWSDQLADPGRLAVLRPHPQPSSGAVLQWTGRERDRGESWTLLLVYVRPFFSSRPALARLLCCRFSWAVRVRRAASLDVRGLAGRNVVV